MKNGKGGRERGNRIAGLRDVTGGNLAEELLRLLSPAVERSSSVVMITDTNGDIEYANPRFTSITGYTAEEAIGTHVSNFGDQSPEDEHRLWQTLSSSGEWRGEFRNRKKNGELYWISASIFPIQAPDGAITHYLGVGEDITERKLAGAALRQAEARNGALLELIPDMMFRMSKDGVYVDFIPGKHSEPLIPPSAFLGKRLHDLLPKEVAEQAAHSLEQALRTGNVEAFEHKLTVGDEVRDFDARIVAISDDECLAIVRDVTERKRAEEALRQSEERYRVLYEDNPTMYFTVDAHGTVLSVNRFGAEQLGYTVDELIGRPVLNVFHEDDKEDVREQLATCVRDPGQLGNWEFRKVRKDGSLMWVKEAARAVPAPDGDTIVLIVCEDITARKQTEEALQEAREELENRVESRLQRGDVYGLTFRELTVLHLVVEGKSDKEIGAVLGISPRTVSKHVENILSKMSASSRTEVGVRAVREGLLE